MSELERIIHDNSNGLDYILVGEIYLPLIAVPEEKREIGFYGSLHRNYLKDYKSGLYSYLTLSGKLWTYLADLNEQCLERRDFLMEQIMEQEGITKELKSRDQMEWVRRANNARSRVDEIILNEYREKYQCIDVVNKEQKFGYIMLLSDRSDRTYPDTDSNIYKTAIEYASIVIILRMQIRISNRMIEEKYYSSFVGDLMLNNVKTREEINTRAHLYGWNLDGGGFVAIIDINNIKKYYLRNLDTGTNEKLQKYTDQIFDTSIKYIKQAFPSTIYYSQSDFIAFLITGKLPVSARKTLADTFSQIQHSLLNAVPFTISMGVGMYVDDIINIHNSYQQAKQVIQTIYQIQQFNRLFFYDQIGIYRLLFSISSNNEAIEFCDKYVKPLQQYDDQHHANLIETLQSIINCGWNLKLASEKLFLHYNSVKYRFQKICDLLEIDEYYGAAEPPVRCGESHLSGLTEPPQFVY